MNPKTNSESAPSPMQIRFRTFLLEFSILFFSRSSFIHCTQAQILSCSSWLQKYDLLNSTRTFPKAFNKTRFCVLIAPHHGTHWDNSLGKIKCLYSISSCGRKLCSKVDPSLKKIAKRPLATYVNGDVIVSVFQEYAFWERTPFYGLGVSVVGR